MKRLDRYIGGAVVNATLLAWLVVSVLDALFVLLGQLADVGRGDYGLGDAVLYVLLGAPTRAWQAFPMAALIGVSLGLGNLAARFELDALRLAGCSPQRLALAVVKAGGLMLLVALALGEGLAPHAEQAARRLRGEAIFSGVSVQPGAGFWVREGRRFIRVKRGGADGELDNVVVYQLAPGARLARITAARHATPEAGHWLLHGVSETRFFAGGVTAQTEAVALWPSLMDARLAQLLTRDSDALSLPALGQYIGYLQRNNGSAVAALRADYWRRLASPVSALAMLLLAVALVLGPLARRTPGQRLLVAVLAGLAFKLIGGVCAHAALVYGLSPALGALLPPTLVLAAIGAASLYPRGLWNPVR